MNLFEHGTTTHTIRVNITYKQQHPVLDNLHENNIKDIIFVSASVTIIYRLQSLLSIYYIIVRYAYDIIKINVGRIHDGRDEMA